MGVRHELAGFGVGAAVPCGQRDREGGAAVSGGQGAAGRDGRASEDRHDLLGRGVQAARGHQRVAAARIPRFIRRGDQRLARLLPNGRVRPEQYAQVVWDLAVDEDPEVLSYVDRVGERDTDPVDDRTDLADEADVPAGTDDKGGETDGSEDVPDPAESRGALNARLENEGQGCTRCTSRGALNARPGVHEMHPSYKEQPSEEPSGLTNNPSAPSGHLPAAGGATPGEGTADDGMACEAGRVLDGLVRLRRGLGLSVREPSKTDGRAVARLLKRLRDRGSRDPSGAVLMVLGSAFEGSWWPRLIRTGRTRGVELGQARRRRDALRPAGRRDRAGAARRRPSGRSARAFGVVLACGRDRGFVGRGGRGAELRAPERSGRHGRRVAQ
ncbi:zinc finger domain-containing protein [Bifidobacterium tsurumiense]|uniref:Zinc finger domain-containing protein n=1 Tax=Bifidobacterium tsurumiense TaxID=356829 RepID=A0A087EBF0_9BIFI|nr:zinc finger domain-containing protein [Bifidobacterium tsurumiense]